MKNLSWKKAVICNAATNCVEVAFSEDGTVHVRDSSDPTGPVLTFSPEEWDAFLEGIRNGDFG